MTDICQLFDSKIDDINSDSVLPESLLAVPDYDPEWLLHDTQLLDSSAEFLSDVAFSSEMDLKNEMDMKNDMDIKNEIEEVKVEVDDLKDFSDISLRDLNDAGSPDEDFVMPPLDIKQSSSPTNDDGDDEDDGNSSSSSGSSTGRSHFTRTTGLITPPDEETYGYPSVRGSIVPSSGSSASMQRPALAVRPLARHATLSSSGGSSVSTVDAATTGGTRPTGIRYLVQRQGNPTVYLQANANGRLRQVVPRLKRQEGKSNDLACSDHYYDNAGSSDDMNGYMVYPPSPPGSSSPENDHNMVSAAAAAGIYPGHHPYSYSSHIHRSGSNHPPPMFQSPIPQSGVLILTEEEKRTLIAEGYSIPTRLPLTKQEERNLKKIRRKIKNKISAQESRRKKKEYVETLEKKVEAYSHENSELKRRVETLESNNRSLINQLRQLQHLVGKAGSSTTSTCLMVFVLFFAAFLAGPALPSSDLHQMGYAASLPRLPGPPLMPPPRIDIPRVSVQESRGLARFYSDDKLTARLRNVLNSARDDVDSPRLLVDSQPNRGPSRRDDCSFASRLWCMFGARCCTPDEAITEDEIEVDGGNVLVVGNATNGAIGKPIVTVVISSKGRQFINATTV